MHRFATWILLFATLPLFGADEVASTSVPVVLKTKAFFTDRIATAVAYFDSEVTPVHQLNRSTEACRILDIRIEKIANEESYAAIIRFQPLRIGSVRLPSLTFEDDETELSTHEATFEVSKRIKSEAMELSVSTDTKDLVYTGQPIRIDLEWKCELPASALRALDFNPSFFNNEQIEVVVPRMTVPEAQQVGIPVGGRRVIAQRIKDAKQPKSLGTIKLPVFIRFTEPGIYTLDGLELECAVTSKQSGEFARYAAHFNNGLFEAISPFETYERHFTGADPIEINVQALPADGKSPRFSGLFEPVDFTVNLSTNSIELGQLVELEIAVEDESPHGMIELPPLNLQSSLRSYFLIDPEYSRLWQASGTLFKTRFRTLSTHLSAFPSMRFQTFDPESAQYVWRDTDPIPITITSDQGEDYIALDTFQDARIPLIDLEDGIWYNHTQRNMNPLLHSVHSFVNDFFWLLLALGPVIFLAAYPLFIEWRKQSVDPIYRKRSRAYNRFRKLPEGNEEKWSAFLDFLATYFDAKGKAWTAKDTRQALEKADLSNDIIEEIEAIHNAADSSAYAKQNTPVKFTYLNSAAQKIRRAFVQTTIVIVACMSLLPSESQATATTWSAAEAAFSEALAAPQGTSQTKALYQEAALLFETAAQAGEDPSNAYYNAGNAWFQANQLGRAIAAYRQSERIQPNSVELQENLSAARALTLNEVPEPTSRVTQIPITWLRTSTIVLSFLFWTALLIRLRFRTRIWNTSAIGCGILFTACAALLGMRSLSDMRDGVVIGESVEARKGPAYAYALAFDQPLYDGLEFKLIEERDGWLRIQMKDGRTCWLPKSQTTVLPKA